MLDSRAFIGASDRAKSLLFALLRQTNVSNNGRLQLTDRWLAEHGWLSAGLNAKARQELLERGLIVQTRSGGLNAGCNWFALTWLQITNFAGLDVSANTYHKGAWNCCTLPATARRKPPEKQITHSDYRSSTTPTTGAVEAPTTPTTGAKTALFSDLTTPATGNNVLHHYPPAQQGKDKRIVGKTGRSGKQASAQAGEYERIRDTEQQAGHWDGERGEFIQTTPRQRMEGKPLTDAAAWLATKKPAARR